MDDSATQEMTALRRELERLNGHRLIRVYDNSVRLLWFQFLRGLAFGLGSVVGATILVSVLVYLLSSVDFIPVLGEWASEIIQVIEGTPRHAMNSTPFAAHCQRPPMWCNGAIQMSGKLAENCSHCVAGTKAARLSPSRSVRSRLRSWAVRRGSGQPPIWRRGG